MDYIKKPRLQPKKFKKRLQSHRKCAIIWWFDKIELPYAPLAQMDRAQASDAWCRRFESAMVRQEKASLLQGCLFLRIMVLARTVRRKS